MADTLVSGAKNKSDVERLANLMKGKYSDIRVIQDTDLLTVGRAGQVKYVVIGTNGEMLPAEFD